MSDETPWGAMSGADKRRWAFEKLELFRGMAVWSDDRVSDEDLFAKADRLVAYINGQPIAEAQSPSAAPSAVPQTEGEHDLQPLEAI